MFVAIRENQKIIGYVEPPKINGTCIYVDDFIGQRAKNGQPDASSVNVIEHCVN